MKGVEKTSPHGRLVNTADHDRHYVCRMGDILIGADPFSRKDCYSADAVHRKLIRILLGCEPVTDLMRQEALAQAIKKGCL